jgi:fluoride exporter
VTARTEEPEERPLATADRPASVADEGRRFSGERLDVLAVIAVGGAVGATARYGIGLGLPTPAGGFPLSTLLVNASGCLLIGILMTLITSTPRVHRLVRPFLGVGMLGGYTTFSTYAVDIQHLMVAGHSRIALGYMVATPCAALLAVYAGAEGSRAVLRARR